jgi:TP901 family phage tail tape measure protein
MDNTIWINIQARLDKLEADLERAKTRTGKAAVEMEKSFIRLEKLKINFDNAIGKMKINEVLALHKKLQAELNKKIAMNMDVKSLDLTRQKIQSVESALRGVGKTAPQGMGIKDLFKTAGAIYGVTAGIAQIKDAVNVYNEFDTKMRNVNTNINVSQQELNGYSQKILDLSTELGKPAAELADAMYQATSAGMAAGDSIKFVELASKAATAGVTDTITAVDGITSVLNAYGMKASEAGKVSDIMFTTVRLGKTTFEQLSTQISDVTPLAVAMGVKFEEVAGAVATLTKQGVPTQRATTQIRAAMEGMNKVLGDGWSKTMSLQEGFVAVREKAGGSNNKLKELVGTTEGMGAILAMTGDAAQMAASDLEEMKNSAGATEKAFAMQADSFQTKINKMNASFDRVKISLVQAFAPAVSWVMDNFADGLDRVTGKADDLEKTLKRMANDYQEGFASGLEGTTAEWRDKELKGIEKKIVIDEENYKILKAQEESMKAQVGFAGAIFMGEDERIKKLRISLQSLRAQRDALKAYNDETKIETGGPSKKTEESSAPKNRTDGGTDTNKKKEDTLKKYYENMKFMDEGYWAYRLQLITNEADEFTKILGSKFDKEKFFIAERKKLNDEYQKWLQDKLDESYGKDVFKFSDKGQLQGRPTAFANDFNVPRQLKEKKDETENPFESLVANQYSPLSEEGNKYYAEGFESLTGMMAGGWGSAMSEMLKGTITLKEGLKSAWISMRNSFLDTISQMISKYAAFAAIAGIGSLIPGLGTFSSIFSFLGGHKGGTFVGVGGGNVTKLATGGSFIVPPGYKNDTFGPLFVESGEKVTVTPANEVNKTFNNNYTTDINNAMKLAGINPAIKSSSNKIESGEKTSITPADQVNNNYRTDIHNAMKLAGINPAIKSSNNKIEAGEKTSINPADKVNNNYRTDIHNAMKLAGGGSVTFPSIYKNDNYGREFLKAGEEVNISTSNSQVTNNYNGDMSTLNNLIKAMNMNITDAVKNIGKEISKMGGSKLMVNDRVLGEVVQGKLNEFIKAGKKLSEI